MKNHIKTGLMIILFILSSANSIAAVDFTMILKASSIAENLLSKSPNNPSINILLGNRELLLGVHKRLDKIEEGLIKALVEIKLIDEKAFKKNMDALDLHVGRDIVGDGQSFIYKINALHIDKLTYGTGHVRYELNKTHTVTFMKEKADSVMHKSLNLLQGENNAGTNAFSIIYAAIIEIAMRIELFNNHNGSLGNIELASKRYIKYLNNVLEPSNENSLMGISNRLIKDINSDYGFKHLSDLAISLDNFEEVIKALLDKNQTSLFCETKQINESYTDTCSRPIHKRSRVRGDGAEVYYEYYSCPKSRLKLVESAYALFSIWVVEVTDNTVSNKNINLLKTDVGTKTTPPNPRDCALNSDHFKGYNQKIINHRSIYEDLANKINLLLQINTILDVAKNTKYQIEKVEKGDYSSFNYNLISGAGTFRLEYLLKSINNINNKEDMKEITELENSMNIEREALDRLIKHQEEEIKNAFAEAAKVTKRNRTILYLKAGAQLFLLFKELDKKMLKDESAKEDFISTAKKIHDSMSANMERTPANVKVLNRVNSFIGYIGYWGKYKNTKEQLEKMGNARMEILNQLSPGESKKFNVLAIGDKFLRYEDPNEFNLRPDNAKVIAEEIISRPHK